MSNPYSEIPDVDAAPPTIIGDVVFGSAESPVAVCTLGTRTLLSRLAGRPEIAVAGRVFTENIGVERMVQNLTGFRSVRFLIVCGRETSHLVGETILALHRNGIDETGRVIGTSAPDPRMPNLAADDLRDFQRRVTVVDMIGDVDATRIIERAAALPATPAEPPADVGRASRTGDAPHVDTVVASRSPDSSWEYDPAGYFVVFVDRHNQQIRAEHHTREHVLDQIFEGKRATDLCQTILSGGGITLLAHAAYLGRELAKAEVALTLDLPYDQDRPLSRQRTETSDKSVHDEGEP